MLRCCEVWLYDTLLVARADGCGFYSLRCRGVRSEGVACFSDLRKGRVCIFRVLGHLSAGPSAVVKDKKDEANEDQKTSDATEHATDDDANIGFAKRE